MKPDECAAVVEYLSEGSTLREASAMVGVSDRAFDHAWITGRLEAESGTDSELAHWFREAQAARARRRATLRSEAAAAAGRREATDLLAVLKALEDEVEPVAVASTDGVRERSWQLDAERYSPEFQELHKTAELATHAAWSRMVEEDTARRSP